MLYYMYRAFQKLIYYIHRAVYFLPEYLNDEKRKKEKGINTLKKEDLKLKHNVVDPFYLVAKGIVPTRIMVHSGTDNMNVVSLASISRIMKHHREFGRVPISVYVCQGSNYIKQQAEHAGLKYTRISLEDDTDMLKKALLIEELIQDACNTGTFIHISYKPYVSLEDRKLWIEEIVTIIVTRIMSIPEHVIMLTVPYTHEQKSVDNIVTPLVEEGAVVHPIIPDSYDHPCPAPSEGKILFPMYHYQQERFSQKRMEVARRELPGLDEEYFVMCYWDFHQAVYDVKGTTGIYFMEERETTIQRS